MQRLEGWRRLWRIALCSDPAPLIVTLAMMTVVWGMALALDGAFQTNPFYAIFADWFCDEAWIGIPAVLVGVGQLIALWSRRRRTLVWLTRIDAACWFGLAAGILASGAAGPAPYLDATLGLAAAWACVLLASRRALIDGGP